MLQVVGVGDNRIGREESLPPCLTKDMRAILDADLVVPQNVQVILVEKPSPRPQAEGPQRHIR